VSPMKTAVIGLGHLGSKVAANLAEGGERVIVSQPDIGKARELARKLGRGVDALAVEEALADADVIVLAVWFNVLTELVVE
jgi:8-hydroxy-5-deazaflavin:NADPH oxidoreductase